MGESRLEEKNPEWQKILDEQVDRQTAEFADMQLGKQCLHSLSQPEELRSSTR